MDYVEITSTILHRVLTSVMQHMSKVDPGGEVVLVAEPQPDTDAIQACRFVLPGKWLIPVSHAGIIKTNYYHHNNNCNLFSKTTTRTDRNYNTISPSAEMLLMTKGYTNIPFAKEAAELYPHPEKYTIDLRDKDFTFWARLAHFESRYWSIDQLLSEIDAKNILEISSGFSFRGLKAVEKNNVHYIDTDLPEIIEVKKNVLHEYVNKSDASGSWNAI